MQKRALPMFIDRHKRRRRLQTRIHNHTINAQPVSFVLALDKFPERVVANACDCRNPESIFARSIPELETLPPVVSVIESRSCSPLLREGTPDVDWPTDDIRDGDACHNHVD